MARSVPSLLLAALLLPAALSAQVRLETDTAPRIVVSVTLDQLQAVAAAAIAAGALVDVTRGATQFPGFQTNTVAFTSRFHGGAPAGLPEVPVTSSVTARHRLAR